MSGAQEPLKPYSYSFSLRAREQDVRGLGKEPLNDTLLSIKETLQELEAARTEDCEVLQYPAGLFCEKHQRPVVEGGTRCDILAQRSFSTGGEDRSRAQVLEYVNEKLGIRDPRIVRRLTG